MATFIILYCLLKKDNMHFLTNKVVSSLNSLTIKGPLFCFAKPKYTRFGFVNVVYQRKTRFCKSVAI